MGVRVKVRIEILDKSIDTSALVNSGFETDSPQIIVPMKLFTKLNIDLDKLGRHITLEYDTAGGPIAMHVYPGSCKVRVEEKDRSSSWVKSDLVISPIEKEVIISDALIEELGIVILSPRRGFWRFIDDPPEKIRFSQEPEHW